jgi:hypothetical protein
MIRGLLRTTERHTTSKDGAAETARRESSYSFLFWFKNPLQEFAGFGVCFFLLSQTISSFSINQRKREEHMQSQVTRKQLVMPALWRPRPSPSLHPIFLSILAPRSFHSASGSGCDGGWLYAPHRGPRRPVSISAATIPCLDTLRPGKRTSSTACA